MDSLKKYLQNHIDELDSDVPGEAVWQRIQNSAAPVLPKNNVVKMLWRYAAAACVLAGIATIFFLVNKKEILPPLVTATTKGSNKKSEAMVQVQPGDADTIAKVNSDKRKELIPAKNTASKELYASNTQPRKEHRIIRKQIIIDPSQLLIQDVEKNYAQLVNIQLERLRVTPVYAESPTYFSTFKQQLKQVEADEIAIKKDIRLHGLTDELLQQLININQQKLNVLKDLQAEISKLNNKVKQPENKQDSSRTYYLTM